MAFLFRDRTFGYSNRDSFSSIASAAAAAIISSASSHFSSITTTSSALSPLPSPFGDLTPTLTAADICETTYEIFVASCRTSTGKDVTYVPSSTDGSPSPSPSSNSNSSSSSLSMQRSLTSIAASKMKKAMGLRSNSSFKIKKVLVARR
nr:protein unc-13 homolog [Ipomoea batatas]